MTMEAKNTREYRLYHNITTPEQEMQRLEAIVRNLKQERDEARRELCAARREVCHLMRSDEYNEPFDGTVFEYAIHRGWDCFKEKTND